MTTQQDVNALHSPCSFGDILWVFIFVAKRATKVCGLFWAADKTKTGN
jgi:hypothetical protein